jgi:formiminotetrahydrofolate cyclodeaminase
VSLLDLPLRDFAGLLVDKGEYGGGSVAALAGSLAAGLIVMVGRVSLEGADGADPHWRDVIEEAEQVSRRLLIGIDDDIRAYDAVVAALRMSRSSDAECAARDTALTDALLQAARVPGQTLGDCVRVLALADSVTGLTRVSLLSDLASAAYLGLGAARAAAVNIKTNAASIPESDEAGCLLASCGACLEEADSLARSIQAGLLERTVDADGDWIGWLASSAWGR